MCVWVCLYVCVCSICVLCVLCVCVCVCVCIVCCVYACSGGWGNKASVRNPAMLVCTLRAASIPYFFCFCGAAVHSAKTATCPLSLINVGSDFCCMHSLPIFFAVAHFHLYLLALSDWHQTAFSHTENQWQLKIGGARSNFVNSQNQIPALH